MKVKFCKESYIKGKRNLKSGFYNKGQRVSCKEKP